MRELIQPEAAQGVDKGSLSTHVLLILEWWPLILERWGKQKMQDWTICKDAC